MKKVFFTLVLLFEGFFSANAQTWVDLESVDYYLEGISCTTIAGFDVTGSYDGDRGTWIGQINRSLLPVLDEDTGYGIIVLVPDANNSLYSFHDLGLFFQYSSDGDGWLY